MEPWAIILLVFGGIVLIAVLARLQQAAAERERQRLAGLSEWAARNSFQYMGDDVHRLHERFAGVFEIGRGHARYACEVLFRSEPAPSFMFRYHYRTWETRTVTYTDSQGRVHTRTERYEETHWRRYLIIETQAQFPSLLIRPEGWFDKLKGFMGFDDVDFESEEFSSRFFVKTGDRQFAYAMIHPQMMQWMLDQSISMQIEQGLVLMELSGSTHDAASCYVRWSQAVGFLNRIPVFVWEDFAKIPPLTFSEPIPPASSAAGAGQLGETLNA